MNSFLRTFPLTTNLQPATPIIEVAWDLCCAKGANDADEGEEEAKGADEASVRSDDDGLVEGADDGLAESAAGGSSPTREMRRDEKGGKVIQPSLSTKEHLGTTL